MHIRVWIWAISILFTPFARADMRWPHETGSGGDAVFCTPTAGSQFRGYYALDYLLSLRGDDRDLVPVAHWDASVARLRAQLSAKYPDLARLFESYVRDLDNHDDYLREHVWEQAAFGLAKLDDQKIIRRLPENCYLKGPQGEAQIIQTVVRIRKPDLTIYHYDPKVYRTLRETLPQQFSFLIIHEWLWDFTSDVEVIRRVNRFLHSDALEKTSARDLKKTLERLGISLGHLGGSSFCDRTPAIREAIARKVGLPCEQIKAVAGLTSLEIESADMVALRQGDFSGLNGLKSLSLRRNALGFLFEDALAGMPALFNLDLGSNRLETLPAGVFRQTPLLFELKLDHNRLRDLPAGLLDGLKNLELVDLGDNELRSFPPNFFHRPSGGKIFIRLSNNRLTDVQGLPPASAVDHIALGGNPIVVPARARLMQTYGDKIIWR